MADYMNLFEPYERKEAHHEDALTRAFLLVIRGVPLAHSAWLALVDRAHRGNDGVGVPGLHELGQPDVRTQVATVPEEIERLLSVVQTDDDYFRKSDATVSERRQVLDGLVTYAPSFGIALENKPLRANIREAQLDINAPKGVELDPRVAAVKWKDVVTAWGALLLAGHLGAAERVLVEDFLDYVEEHFARLRPYSTIAQCGKDTGRLKRRCEAILQEIAPGRVAHHQGWSWFINLDDDQCAKKVALMARRVGDSAQLIVEFDPGDTVGQAKTLFRDVAIEDLSVLISERGWNASPSFHLIYITTGFFRPKPKTDVLDYWRSWAKRVSQIRQWRREEFEAAFATLLEAGVVDESDRPAFEKSTINTKRPRVGFAAGIVLQWRIPIDEAAALDDRGVLIEEVKAAMERGARALRLRLPWL